MNPKCWFILLDLLSKIEAEFPFCVYSPIGHVGVTIIVDKRVRLSIECIGGRS